MTGENAANIEELNKFKIEVLHTLLPNIEKQIVKLNENYASQNQLSQSHSKTLEALEKFVKSINQTMKTENERNKTVIKSIKNSLNQGDGHNQPKRQDSNSEFIHQSLFVPSKSAL